MIETAPVSMLGQELDTSADAFGTLRDSSEFAGDYAELNARLASEGYLYLRGYLNRDEVIAARAECTRRLAESGRLDPAHAIEDAVMAPGVAGGFTPDLAENNAPLMTVLYEGPMIRLYEGLFGEAVRHYDFTWLRAVSTGRSTPPHVDSVYMNRGTLRLCTSWTPLGDIPIEMGGLCVLDKGHTHERINQHYGMRDVDKFCENPHQPGASRDNVGTRGELSRNPVKLRQNLGGRWLSADYRMGDVVIFTIFTIHGGLDNHTNRIRLSSDSRYQRASEPADERWIGPNPIGHGPEAKRGHIC